MNSAAIQSISFHWVRPEMFYLLAIPALVALWVFWGRRRPAKKVSLFFLRHLDPVEAELKKTRNRFRMLFFAFLSMASLLAVLIARPQTIQNWTRQEVQGIDIAIVLDVSESMDATDFKPNRMVAAKTLIRDFIQRRKNDRIGLVIFGGEAVTKSPLTKDYEFLMDQVSDLELRELKQGTAIGLGLTGGIARLRNSTAKTKVVVLLTDGDSNVGAINPITAAHLARQEGIRVYTIGIGREERVIVPIYSYDSQGRKGQLVAQIPSYLNPQLLIDIAKITGGAAYMAKDNGMLAGVLAEIDSLERSRIKMIPMANKNEVYMWPALAIFFGLLGLFILVETRYKRHWRPLHASI